MTPRWKTPKAQPPPEPRAAVIRIKLKGAEDGHVYQGQKLIRRCPGCRPV